MHHAPLPNGGLSAGVAALSAGVAALSAGVAALSALSCSPQGPLVGDGPIGTRSATGSLARSDVIDAGLRPYPLASAPLIWAEQQKLVAGDGAAGDEFGFTAALSGDTALVGAPYDDDAGNDSGSAYVFSRNASPWLQRQKLVASDAAAGDEFGDSVAVDGDTAFIGAARRNERGDFSGAVYVFVRSAATWTEQQKLLASDTGASDFFGGSVTVKGDTALVGTSSNEGKGFGTGSAYVFVRSATTWTEEQKLTASDGAAADHFGRGLALSANSALISAPFKDDAGNASGTAYVFVRTASAWLEQQKLMASDGAATAIFGIDVALDGDTALIGAYGDSAKGLFSGAAYIFERAAATWTEKPKLVAGDGAESDGFGVGVALEADTALIGAYHDDGADFEQGSVYVFARGAGSWAEQRKLMASDGAGDDFFGSSVALSGGTALIGAKGDGGVNVDVGSAYVVALLSVAGEACASKYACASGFCADGVCCTSVCEGPCEACNVAGAEGTCTLAPGQSMPASTCGGILCDGNQGNCPTACGGDTDCQSGHYCQASVACTPKTIDGEACTGNSGCLSGHCVDGICCAQACDEGCGSCVIAGSEGICTPLEAGHPGVPSCEPNVCTGTEHGCPTTCDGHDDCTAGHHCAQGACTPDSAQGANCTDDNACASAHCTDGVCCTAESCGAYRCGPIGACEAACSSSAQCAQGHQCDSAGRCVFSDQPDADDAGACHVANARGSAPGAPEWPGGMGLLGALLSVRRRRSTRHALRRTCPSEEEA